MTPKVCLDNYLLGDGIISEIENLVNDYYYNDALEALNKIAEQYKIIIDY